MSSINVILSSTDLAYVEQVLWLVGNISGESEKMREFVLDKIKIIECLGRLVQMPRTTKTFLRTMCWVSSNLSRSRTLNSIQVGETLLTNAEGDTLQGR